MRRGEVFAIAEGGVACSPLVFEDGQVVFEDFLRPFKLQQELLQCFSVATAFLKLFEVLSLPGN